MGLLLTQSKWPDILIEPHALERYNSHSICYIHLGFQKGSEFTAQLQTLLQLPFNVNMTRLIF